MLRLIRKISVPQLRASWGRTLLVIGGVAIGVALIAAINVINTTVLTNFQRTLESIAGPAELEVLFGTGEIGFAETVLDTVRTHPDVQVAIPVVRGAVRRAGDAGEALQLLGVDLTDEDALRRYRVALTTDRTEWLEWLNDPRAIALTRDFVAAHALGIGKTVELVTPHGKQRFTIRGILEPDGLARAFGSELAVMDLPAAQRLLAKQGRLDQIEIVLRDGSQVAAAQQRLQAVVPPSLTVQPPLQRGAQYEQILRSFQTMLLSVSLLCLVAGTYIIYNTTSTAAVHRAFVMGNLRLIGADARQLFSLLIAESLLLGALGSTLGLGAGILLARALTNVVSRSMGIVFQLDFAADRMSVDPWHLAAIALLGVLTAPLASYVPARRLAARDPLAVVRPDVHDAPDPVPARRLVALWIALLVVCGAAFCFEVERQSIAWGNFGSTLWFASSIVIAVPLVSACSGLLSRLLSRISPAAGRMAAESLFRSPTRTGVTAAAITLVLTVAIGLATLTQSLRQSASKYYQDGGYLLGDVVVSAATTEGGWLETPLPESLAGEISGLPGVRSVETARALPGFTYRHERGLDRVTLLGLSDGLLADTHYGAWWYVEGQAESAARALQAGAGVNVSVAFADRFRKHVGDRLDLDTPSGRVTLPIVGVVRDYMSDRGTITVNRRLLADDWNDRAVNRFSVFLAAGARAEDVQERIKALLGSRYLLKVLLPAGMVRYHVDKIDQAFAFTDAIQLLIAVVTVAGIFDLLVAAIWERRRELALWRVIGADDSILQRAIIAESATIGGFGVTLGIIVGILTAFIWIRVHFRYLFGFYLEYAFDSRAMATDVLMIVAMTMLAGWIAARYAIGLSVLDGIQVE